MKTQSTFALVTGGGTGGHVYPALAVAEELVHRGHARSTIHFVGAERGLEATAVPAAGFAIELLPGRGIRRSMRPSALRANAGALFGTLRAFARAFRLVGKLEPRVVLGVGGFASLPCIVAARLRRVPAVVHEQNAAPGLANRIGVRFGARAAVSFSNTPLRNAVLTGNPIRPEIASVNRTPVTPPMIAVFGGSLGARQLNDATLELYERWRDRTDVSIVHLTGTRDHERCTARLDELRRPSDRLAFAQRAYEDHMVNVYSTAAMVVCRAGAITIAELAASGMPAVVVPLPNAPHDHQTRNGEALARLGAAVLVPDEELDGPRLDRELRRLLDDPALLVTMGHAGKGIARPDAAARVADMVEAAGHAA